MSIFLDALRARRGRQTPEPNPNAAQTDAVLQTLGYGKLNPTTPLNRVKRLLAILALGIVLAIVLWAVVISIAQVFLSPASGPDIASAPQTAPAPAPAPASAPDGTMAGKPNAPIAPPVTNAVPVGPPRRPAESHLSHPTRLAVRVVEHPLLHHPRVAEAHPPPREPLRRASLSHPTPPRTWHRPSGCREFPARQCPGCSADCSGRRSLSHDAFNGSRFERGDRHDSDDHFRRAMMYQRLGEFENALVSYRQVLQRDDLNVEAHNNLGVLYRDKGLLDDAVRHFQRAIAINPAMRARATISASSI